MTIAGLITARAREHGRGMAKRSQLFSRQNDSFEMIHGPFRYLRVRIQRVGIITQRRNTDAVFRAKAVYVVSLCFCEIDDINMRHPGEFPFRFATGPASDFEAGEFIFGSKLKDPFKGEIREDRGKKSELHNAW